ncbi:TlpA family protein disulfide reductase [Shewanella maritima]|uniref:TlpA family protein disulfide reductase n=1 Tax=Shewanella maritima TaxID=2520507 RepID=UPI003736A7EF
MKKIVLLSIYFVFTNCAFAQTYEEKREASLALIGQPVQDHTFLTLNKQEVTFDSLKGKTTIAYFFASWCSPCYTKLENLGKAIEDKTPTVNVIAISLDEDWVKLERMLVKTGYTAEVWKSSSPKAVLQNRMFANFSGSLPHIVKINEHGILEEINWHIESQEQWSACLSGEVSLSEASRI